MVTTIPATAVEAGAVYVDPKGKHIVEDACTVRGQVALMIDGFWNYFTPASMLNVLA